VSGGGVGVSSLEQTLEALLGLEMDCGIAMVCGKNEALRARAQAVADRFGGYAMAQLKRIRTHRAWLLAPPRTPAMPAAGPGAWLMAIMPRPVVPDGAADDRGDRQPRRGF
jgi:hypothetical protein